MGWIFTQSAAERDYIMSSEEVQQMAAMQVGPKQKRLETKPQRSLNYSHAIGISQRLSSTA